MEAAMINKEASTALVLYSEANMAIQPRGGRPPMHSDDLSDYRIVELEKSKAASESKLDRIEAEWSKKFDAQGKDIVDWKIDTTKAITELKTTIKIASALVVLLMPVLTAITVFFATRIDQPTHADRPESKAIASHVSNIAAQAASITGN